MPLRRQLNGAAARGLAGRPIVLTELAGVVAVLAIAAMLAYGWYVGHGAPYADDYGFAGHLRFDDAGPAFLPGGATWDPARPLLGTYLALTFGLLGVDPKGCSPGPWDSACWSAACCMPCCAPSAEAHCRPWRPRCCCS